MQLSKLIGKHYKWLFIIQFYFKTHIAYLGDTVIRALAEFFILGSTILIWFATTQNNSSFDVNEIITYLVIGFLYTAFTMSWYAEDLSTEIKTGTLISSLLKPTQKFWVSICEYVGRGTLGECLATIVPLMLLLPFVLQFIAIPELPNLVFTILFIPISFFIKHSLESVFGSFAFWFVGDGGMMRLRSAIESVLEGSKIPLNILTVFVPGVLWTPYAFLLHYPVQIWLGKYDIKEIIGVYCLGIVWCLVLFMLSRFVFKLGLKRNEAVGL